MFRECLFALLILIAIQIVLSDDGVNLLNGPGASNETDDSNSTNGNSTDDNSTTTKSPDAATSNAFSMIFLFFSLYLGLRPML
ncbi:unnamed protein product, partial [Mesorhabditis belari]|uniref:Uncharacterized protein n=1 Tax=Mesorhabditis belari TaxID=2138241 RepID=A0AAF3FH06_9BILA